MMPWVYINPCDLYAGTECTLTLHSADEGRRGRGGGERR